MTIVATLLVMVLALVFGVWMARSRTVDFLLRPVLDAGQTIPAFVYLIPVLALFGPTRFTAIVAGLVYAAPAAIKLVADGVSGVNAGSVEAGRSVGSTTWQEITKVQLPMAKGSLVLATNQGLLYVLVDGRHRWPGRRRRPGLRRRAGAVAHVEQVGQGAGRRPVHRPARHHDRPHRPGSRRARRRPARALGSAPSGSGPGAPPSSPACPASDGSEASRIRSTQHRSPPATRRIKGERQVRHLKNSGRAPRGSRSRAVCSR